MLEVECLRLDKLSLRAWVNDQDVGLTELEFKLLALLVEANGEPCSAEQLGAELVHGDSDGALPPVAENAPASSVDGHIEILEELLDAAALLEKSSLGYEFA